MNDFRDILSRMLERIPDDIDKREGSVIYDALAPAALELARFYSALSGVIDETFADSAGREMLVRRAAERGISPYPATFAVVRGEFNTAVAVGARFSLDDLRYRVIEGNRLACENIGTVGNRSAGDLKSIDFIEGLSSARIIELLIPGENEEEIEHLRKRYFDSLETQSYGGNIADYRRMTLGVQGVGGVKVEPVWNGGGTVRLVIQDYQWGVPSGVLVAQAQNSIDESAPIGHKVTVIPVSGVVIDIYAKLSFVTGWSFDDVRFDLEKIAGEYLGEISREWDKSVGLIIRASQIEARFLNHAGILDIEDLQINGGASGRNVVLSANEIPVLGVVGNAD
jgi:uncharacterized phage protein gp47/JayE